MAPYGWSKLGQSAAALSARDLLQAITEPANRGNPDRALLDLLAQTVHVDLDRVVADLLAPLAQALDELVLADQAARALKQHFQQRDLPRGQLDHLVIDVADAAGGVEVQRAVLEDRAGSAQAAPSERPHPR